MKVRLTDICTPRQWKTIPTSELLSEGYPVYGANGIIGYYNGYNHESPVVTITCRGATCGTINITAPKSYVTGNAMCLDDLRPDVLLEYLYYSLLHYNFRNVISGSAQPQITRQGLEKVNIELHSLDEQRTIIHVLSKLERIILARKEELQKLDNLVKARFVEMFDSDSWDTVRAGSIMFDMRNGISPSNKGSHPAKVLTLSALTQGAFDAEAWKEGLFDFVPPKEKRVVSSDFYMCRGNGNKKLVGAGVYSTEDRYDLIFPDTVIAASVDQQRVCLPYLSQAWKQPSVRKQIEQGARTTNGTYKINQGVVASIEIKLPPRELQQQFAAFVEEVDKSKVVVQRALDEAQTLFDSLMQQYFG